MENRSIDTAETDGISENTSIFISVDEMAKLMSIARVTAYQLTKLQGFPCFYVGKRIIIPLQSLCAWAEKQAQGQNVLLEK